MISLYRSQEKKRERRRINMTPDQMALAMIRYVVFLFSTTCHEAAHALAAKFGGDLTAAEGGQVTLNPIPHIRREPVGMVVVPLLGLLLGGMMMGWASAPYDPAWQRRYPKRAGWMSLAGPAANFTLMLLAAALIHLGIAVGVFQAPHSIDFSSFVEATRSGPWEGAAKLVSIFFSLNMFLGTFNLLPIPPLDGYSALALFMNDETAHKLEDWRQTIGQFTFIGLLVGWKLFDFLFDPIFSLAIRLLYPSLSYS
jgi:Zn-dependent protease